MREREQDSKQGASIKIWKFCTRTASNSVRGQQARTVSSILFNIISVPKMVFCSYHSVVPTV